MYIYIYIYTHVDIYKAERRQLAAQRLRKADLWGDGGKRPQYVIVLVLVLVLAIVISRPSNSTCNR